MARERLQDAGLGRVDPWPRWTVEALGAVAFRPQIVLSGNVRDLYMTPSADGLVAQGMIPCLSDTLRQRSVQFLLVYDLVDGLSVYPKEARQHVGDLVQVEKVKRLADLWECMRSVASCREKNCALIIDYASRIVPRPDQPDDAEYKFVRACEKLSQTTLPVRVSKPGQIAPYNPIIWLVNHLRDLPSWFLVGNEGLRTITVSLPDQETRKSAALVMSKDFPEFGALSPPEAAHFIGRFADLADGLTLRGMHAIIDIACDQEGLPRHDLESSRQSRASAVARIADAVRWYKVGVLDTPWKTATLRERIASAQTTLDLRVKGQGQAVKTVLDILKRSALGLSGAQSGSTTNRPRGVLFFAGPTGVGKTELAKAITSLIFGDDQAYVRFDMSEFSAEHSEARLVGAPPGYIGYDSGGELVNAVRQRPFSVLLFDEIEKAHPRILDKFLQILEDGRLTDGRGDTVYFSEAIIVFTSNLGVFKRNRNQQGVVVYENDEPVPNALPTKSYEVNEKKLRIAIEDFFRFELNRPELLNRIGENIVVFDFIRPPIDAEIFSGMLENVIARVQRETGISVVVGDVAMRELTSLCTADLRNGGRGIGNKLELTFVNPLARALFELRHGQSKVMVNRIVEGNGGYSVVLE